VIGVVDGNNFGVAAFGNGNDIGPPTPTPTGPIELLL
jgi:hypothetical protein